MPTDIDIYRTANELVKQHGEDATAVASMKADELLDAGDMDAYRVWLRIYEALNDLLLKKGTMH